jgi:branched-chain amino acid transport system ATP-binding protein
VNAPLLEVTGVDASYGPVQILFGLDLTIDRGEIVALLGTNGAGKSTLFKVITGLLPATNGTVRFDDADITNRSTTSIVEQGMVMMPGGRSVFPTLTVKENLRLAGWIKRRKGRGADADADEERVLALFPRLRERYAQLAGDLSGGEQQMLAISQALMPDPKLLLIDELSLGLAPTVVGQLIDVVHQAHESGVTICVVEQSINVALKLAERAVFMEKGEFRFTGPTRELLEHPELLRSVFIGGAAPASSNGRKPKPATSPKDPELILETRQVAKRFGGITAVNRVDLQLHRGEIVGLIGQNGAGKTTLFDCISGFLPIDGGRILLHGDDIAELRPHRRAQRGLGRSFQEARLFPTLTTAETIAIARERHLLARGFVAAAFQQPVARSSEADIAAKVELLVDLMGLGAFAGKLTGELSTGTRRIVELACLLAADPDVIILDEPSGGVAQRETEALGPLLKRVQGYTGTSILVIEHDMPLLRGICDRMYALELGAVIAEGTPTEVLEHPRVIESYLGTELAAINRSG